MKYLIYLAIAGYLCWIGSEIIEIVEGGYNNAVYFLTSAYHVLAGFGIWGIHLLQNGNNDRLSQVGTALVSITYLALGYFPIQVMHSGMSVSDYMATHTGYQVAGLMSLIGFIIFGISVLRIRYFPRWTGMILIAGTVFFAIAISRQWQLLVNINNIFLSLTIIFMGLYGLRKLDAVIP